MGILPVGDGGVLPVGRRRGAELRNRKRSDVDDGGEEANEEEASEEEADDDGNEAIAIIISKRAEATGLDGGGRVVLTR